MGVQFRESTHFCLRRSNTGLQVLAALGKVCPPICFILQGLHAPFTGYLYPGEAVQRELECTRISLEPSSCYMISWCATCWFFMARRVRTVAKCVQGMWRFTASGKWVGFLSNCCVTFSSPASPVFWCGICSVLVPSLPLKSSLVIWTCDIFHPWDALSSFCFDIGDAFKKILFVFTWDVAHCCQKLNLIHYYGVLRLGKNPRGNLMWMKKHNPKDIKKDNLVMRGCGKQTRILIFVSWTPKCSHLIIWKFEDSST